MSYQIPATTQALIIEGEDVFPLKLYTPTSLSKLQHCILTMFLKGHLATSFNMRVNVYSDAAGSDLLFSSTPINNLDITRVGDYYCDLKFDFPDAGNRLSINGQHLIEFEVYGGYTYDVNNYLSLILEGAPAQHKCALFSLKR